MLTALTDSHTFSSAFDRMLTESQMLVQSGSAYPSYGTGIVLFSPGETTMFSLLAETTSTGLCTTFSGSQQASDTGTVLILHRFSPPS